jgi:predicted membrane-bound spermidine synthase
MQDKRLLFLLLLISFIEGGSLMAFEILSSKLYTPFLGSSIYVWTSILTLTLAGLALGYRIGGKLSVQQPNKHLRSALVIAALTMLISIYTSGPILEAMLSMDVKTASLLGGILIIFIPVTAMGTVSPLIIGIMNQNGSTVSSASGVIYGTGTIGGIVLLLLTTFVLIPTIGVSTSVLLFSLLMLCCAGLVFLIKSQRDEK